MRTQTLRINRFSQLVRSFRVARLLLWTIWVIYRERKRVVRARARGNYEVRPNVEVLVNVLVAFRQTAISLGVLMIKLGQFLSSRADLLPEQALAVLASLQDEVPPVPFEQVVAVIETEYGQPVEELFSVLERKCTAAASLGQVHKAVLAKTGETVAVKVQRPGIAQLVSSDLSTLKFVIWVINRFVDTSNFIDLNGVFREFRKIVYEEIDFVTEATNAQRFAEMFADDPTIYIPYVYKDYIRRRVLVIEWIEGTKVNDYAALDAAGIDRLEVANRMVSAYFHQFFEVGFFHADPHPGNIFVKKGSSPEEPVIVFLDFGMVGSVSKSMKQALKDLFLGVVARNPHLMVESLSKLGFVGEGANIPSIERALALMLDQYYDVTLSQVRNIDMREVGQEVMGLLYDQPFHIPAQLAFTGRAASTLLGVSTGLAPDFNFISIAMPYAQAFLGLDANNVRETAQDLLKQAIEVGRVLLTLPSAVERLIARIESGQVEVRLANLSSRRRSRSRGTPIDSAAGGGSAALLLVFLASLASGLYLTMAHLAVPGWFCLALAAVSTLGIILKK